MLILMNVLLLILIILVLWLVLKRHKKDQQSLDPIAAMQSQIDGLLEELKQHIDRELNKFTKHSTVGVYKQDTQVADEVDSSIVKARKNIDGKIAELRKNKKIK